MVKFIGVNNH